MLGHKIDSPYPSRQRRVTFPLHPVIPKNIPLAMASFRASVRILLTLPWNLRPSCALALYACTVRKAESDSVAILIEWKKFVWMKWRQRFYLMGSIPLSFLQRLPESDWKAFSSSDHTRPANYMKVWNNTTELRRRTAPNETGGTTASINIVRVGET